MLLGGQSGRSDVLAHVYVLHLGTPAFSFHLPPSRRPLWNHIYNVCGKHKGMLTCTRLSHRPSMPCTRHGMPVAVQSYNVAASTFLAISNDRSIEAVGVVWDKLSPRQYCSLLHTGKCPSDAILPAPIERGQDSSRCIDLCHVSRHAHQWITTVCTIYISRASKND